MGLGRSGKADCQAIQKGARLTFFVSSKATLKCDSAKSMSQNVNLRRWAIIGLGLILTIALIILVWNKQPTIYPYLFVAIALASLVTFSIIGYYKGTVDKLSTVCLVFIVFLFLRSVQFVATRYGALMLGDVTFEYAVINTFAQAEKIFVIPESAFSHMLTWYSSWPLLHTSSLIFADVLSIKASLLPVVLPTIFSFIGFAFVYLIANRLVTDLKINKVIVPLSLLFYAISPEAIYYGFKFVRTSLALVLLLAEFYLLYKYISHRDSRILALIILNALAIVLTHHYTSFIFTAYLLAFAALALVLASVGGKVRRPVWVAKLPKFKNEAVTIGLVAVVSGACVVGWWSYVATVIQERAGAVASRIVEMEVAPLIPEAHYPKALTPPWVNLLWARDFLIYVPVFFGFVWLIRQKFRKRTLEFNEERGSYFLVLSLICFGAFFLFELFISHVETFRIVILSLPFVTLCSAMLYVKMLSHGRWLKRLTFAALVFVIISSFLGLWGHRHAPIHLYSSAVSAWEVGEATALDDRHYSLWEFVSENQLDLKSDEILSDDNSLLYRLLSPEEYQKIGPRWGAVSVELDNCIANDANLAVIDFGNRFYSHYGGPHAPVGLVAAEEVRAEYRNKLESNLNKIYDNGLEVWAKWR